MASAEPLPHFVDDYLAYLHETEPTNATLDGVHVHDDLLEDLARPAIEARARSLAGFARRLTEIDSAGLTEVEKIDQRVLASTVRGRMFELEDVRTWERNPQIYADVLSSSLAAQSIFDYAPESERARRVLSKLRQAPRLMQAARDNVKDPPGILVKVSLETLRGTLTFIEKDLPRAFSSIDDLHLLGDLADASTEAAQAVGAYVEYLENEVAPRARSSFRLGRERFEQKLKLEEGIDLDIDRLLAIAMRELHQTQEEFKTAAGRLNGGDPIESWRRIKEKHPSPGGLITVAQEQIDELASPCPRASPSSSRRHRTSTGGRSRACGPRGPSSRSRRARTTTSPTPFRRGRPIGRRSTCATSTTRRSSRSRFTRCIPATSCTISGCGRSSPRFASPSCSRRPPLWRAGPTTAST
jgi:hypothetical protein